MNRSFYREASWQGRKRRIVNTPPSHTPGGDFFSTGVTPVKIRIIQFHRGEFFSAKIDRGEAKYSDFSPGLEPEKIAKKKFLFYRRIRNSVFVHSAFWSKNEVKKYWS